MANSASAQNQPVRARPVVLLDIDDCLATNRAFNTRQVIAALSGESSVDAEAVWQGVFHEAAKQNLRLLHDEFGPCYVLSSSWTLHLSKEQLGQTFMLTGLEFVAENLHEQWCTPRDDDSYRLIEIDAWIDTYALSATAPYLIIDDNLSGQSLRDSHLEANTVFCEPWTGFMYPQLRRAREILRRQVCVEDSEIS